MGKKSMLCLLSVSVAGAFIRTTAGAKTVPSTGEKSSRVKKWNRNRKRTVLEGSDGFILPRVQVNSNDGAL